MTDNFRIEEVKALLEDTEAEYAVTCALGESWDKENQRLYLRIDKLENWLYDLERE